MGQGSIDIYGLGGYLQLLLPLHAIQGAHIVQTVSQLDKDHPGVVRKGQQDLLKVLRLLGSIDIDDVGYLGEPVHNTGDLATEFSFNIFQRNIRVFHRVVQKGADGAADPQSYLLGADTRHSQRMEDIRLPALAAHGLVRLGSHFKGHPDQFLVPDLQFWLEAPEKGTVFPEDKFLFLFFG